MRQRRHREGKLRDQRAARRHNVIRQLAMPMWIDVTQTITQYGDGFTRHT